MTKNRYQSYDFEKYLYLVSTEDNLEKLIETLQKDKTIPFGYCPICSELTAYEGSYGIDECSETCLECHRTFLNSPTYLTRGDIPARLSEKAKALMSREFQIALAKLAIAEKIHEAKTARREANKTLEEMGSLEKKLYTSKK